MSPSTTIPSLSPYKPLSKPRLTSLYSDFSAQKLSNPPGYAANLTWWRSVLEEASERGLLPTGEDGGGSLVLEVGDELLEALRAQHSNGGSSMRPSALGCVIADLLLTSSLLPLKPFLTSPTSIYSTPSIPSRIASTLIARPLWWSLGQLNIVSTEANSAPSAAQQWKKVQNQQFVVKATLEKAATNLLSHLRTLPRTSPADVLFSPASFRTTFASNVLPSVILSARECAILIKHLERDKGVLIRTGDVIKFASSDSSSSIPPITSVDESILEMTTTVSKLQDQISELEARIAERQSKLTLSLQTSQPKSISLSHLRSKNALLALLAKRTSSLATLQQVVLSIETAHGDIDLLATLERSSGTLKTLLDGPELDKSRVEGIMTGLADTLADQREIEEVMEVGGRVARAGASGVEEGEEEGELERELEGLVREQEADFEAAVAKQATQTRERETLQQQKEVARPPEAVTDVTGEEAREAATAIVSPSIVGKEEEVQRSLEERLKRLRAPTGDKLDVKEQAEDRAVEEEMMREERELA